MSAPRFKWDGTVNVPVIVTIVAGVFSVGLAQAQLNSHTQKIDDHEVRLRTVEGSVASSLARIEEKVANIERRLEGR